MISSSTSPTTGNAFTDILGGAQRCRDNVNMGLKAYTGHSDGLPDAVLVINHIFLRQHMQDFLIAATGTARAASSTRSTSPSETSLSLMATVPSEFRLRI